MTNRTQVVCAMVFFGWRVSLLQGMNPLLVRESGGPFSWWRPTLRMARAKGEKELRRYGRIVHGQRPV